MGLGTLWILSFITGAAHCLSAPVQGVESVVRSRVGGSAVLGCNLTPPSAPPPFPLHVIEWVRLGWAVPVFIKFGLYSPRVHPNYQGRVSLAHGASLRIDGLLLQDEGWFECRILFLDRQEDEFQNGTWTFLSITAPPVFIKTPPPVVETLEGNSLALTCSAHGKPQPIITWRKDDVILESGKKLELSNGTVFLSPVGRASAGQYECQASNEEGNITHSAQLLVLGPPVIVLQPADLSLNVSQDAALRCRAEAYPSNLTYLWWKGGENVFHIQSLKSRVRILVDGTLLIQRVIPEDAGNYSCVPTNGILTPPTASAYIRVLHPAQAVDMPAETYLPMGMQGVITCPVRADPPVLFVNWTKDGRPLDIETPPGWVVNSTGSVSIATANEDALGSYTCTPYNSYGTVGQSAATRVVLQDPPTFRLSPRAEYLQEVGRELIISCAANGDPAPNITWTKVGLTPRSLFGVAVNGSLILSPLSKDHQGAWECHARNRVATVSTRTSVSVLGTSPHAVSELAVTPGVNSANLTWEPGFDGGYTQRFSVWLKRVSQGKHEWTSLPVPLSQYSLLVSSLFPDTAYQFSVLPQNKLGSGPFSEIVTVLTLPVPQTEAPPPLVTSPPLLNPPSLLSVNQSLRGVVLRWNPPLSPSPSIKGIILQSRHENGDWTVLDGSISANQSEILVQGLLRDYNYELRLLSLGDNVISAPSESINISTAGMDASPSQTRLSELLPGPILAGVVGGVSFLCVAIVLSVLTACIMNQRRGRRRRKRREDLTHAFQKDPSPPAGSFIDSPDSIMKLRPLLYDHAPSDKARKSHHQQRQLLLANPLASARYAIFESYLGGSAPPTSPIESISRGPDGRFIVQPYPECITPACVKNSLKKHFPQDPNGLASLEHEKSGRTRHSSKSHNCFTTNEEERSVGKGPKKEHICCYVTETEDAEDWSKSSGCFYTNEQEDFRKSPSLFYASEDKKLSEDWSESQRGLYVSMNKTEDGESAKSNSVLYEKEKDPTERSLSESSASDFSNITEIKLGTAFPKSHRQFYGNDDDKLDIDVQKRSAYFYANEKANGKEGGGTIEVGHPTSTQKDGCPVQSQMRKDRCSKSEVWKEKYNWTHSGVGEGSLGEVVILNPSRFRTGGVDLSRQGRAMEIERERAVYSMSTLPLNREAQREKRLTNASTLVSQMEREREGNSLNRYYKHTKERESRRESYSVSQGNLERGGWREREREREREPEETDPIWKPQAITLRSKNKMPTGKDQGNSGFRKGCYFGNTSSPLGQASSSPYIHWDISPVTSITTLIPVQGSVQNMMPPARKSTVVATDNSTTVKQPPSISLLSPHSATFSSFAGDIREAKSRYPENIERQEDMDAYCSAATLVYNREREKEGCAAFISNPETEMERDHYSTSTIPVCDPEGGSVREGEGERGVEMERYEACSAFLYEREEEGGTEGERLREGEGAMEHENTDDSTIISPNPEKEGVRTRSRKSDKYNFSASAISLSPLALIPDNDTVHDQSDLSIYKSLDSSRVRVQKQPSRSTASTSQRSKHQTSAILEYLSSPGFIEMSVDDPIHEPKTEDPPGSGADEKPGSFLQGSESLQENSGPGSFLEDKTALSSEFPQDPFEARDTSLRTNPLENCGLPADLTPASVLKQSPGFESGPTWDQNPAGLFKDKPSLESTGELTTSIPQEPGYLENEAASQKRGGVFLEQTSSDLQSQNRFTCETSQRPSHFQGHPGTFQIRPSGFEASNTGQPTSQGPETESSLVRPPEAKRLPFRTYLPRGYSWPSPYHSGRESEGEAESEAERQGDREAEIEMKDVRDVKEARASFASQSSGRGSVGPTFAPSLHRYSLSLTPSLPASPETTQNEAESETQAEETARSVPPHLGSRAKKRRDTSVDESYEWDSVDFPVESEILEALKLYSRESKASETAGEWKRERPRSTIAVRELESRGLLSPDPPVSPATSQYRLPVRSLKSRKAAETRSQTPRPHCCEHKGRRLITGTSLCVKLLCGFKLHQNGGERPD
ncbi:hypothetical protein AOXY_G28589 [Acipenser oxyrinchus oxyrinchus]|uniref:Uncharacterized protein n=1 Tax=Acipenser oxyrinchus oxyrinchus TaxID=40147 RepID=A0AAD8CRI3_ACIOX|nr:hypothetical protein AOXY_G28589 [Acipenser oxyrinchus oxyrinchus]